MKILVTGATGFLGSRLIYRLKEQGYSPIALGRNRKIGEQLGVPFIPCDLSEGILPVDADQVVHCAALSSPWGSDEAFYKANVLATQNLLEACKEVKRFIHISTPSLYFDYQDRYNVKESDPLPKKFVNAYARTKKEAEGLVNQASIPTVILRPRGLFGPGDTVLFPRLIRALEKKMLPLIDDGKALIDITYIDNVVDAILLSIQAGRQVEGNTYNITNDDPKTFHYLMKLLCEKTQVPFKTRKLSFKSAYFCAKAAELLYTFSKNEPPITCYGIGILGKSMTLDINKAKRDLGYAPKVSIEEGIEAFAKWWKK